MVIDFNKGNGGGGSGYTLPIASEQQLGGIKVGSGLSITTAGTLSADAQPVGVATTASTGVVKIGQGINVDSAGTINANKAKPIYDSQTSDGGTVCPSTNGQIKIAQDSSLYLKYNEAAPTSWAWFEYWDYEGDGSDENGWYIHLDQEELESVSGSLVTKEIECTNGESDFYGATFNVIMGWGIRLGIYDDLYYYLSLGWYEDNLYFIQYIGDGDGYEVHNAVQIDWGGFDMDLGYDTTVYDSDIGVIVVDTESQRCLEPFNWYGIGSNGGGEEIEKTSTYNWGTLKLANGIALEVNDSDEGQGVVLGVSAGENVVFGNGVGEEENNSKGLRAPVQSYTQYDLDIVDDHDNSICVVDSGVGTIDFKNFVLGSDGTYFYLTNGDSLAERFIRIYVDEGVPYVECSTDGGSESCEIQFQNDGDYKDFRLVIDNTVLQVFESYDNYENIIAEIENAEFVEGYNHIQLFDKDYNMESGAIGTIIFNNTDFIKPYYDYDGDSVQNVGFVLKKRSYTESL